MSADKFSAGNINEFSTEDIEEIIRILTPMNPWWNTRDWEKVDQEIQAYSKSSVKWNPRLMYLIYNRIIKNKTTGVITVRGPRRLGKTTMVKRLIQMMEGTEINPYQIVYIQCDDPSIDHLYENTHGALRFLILGYQQYAHQNKIPFPLFIFLDEATFYKGNWAKEIKSLVDRGQVKDKLLIYVTGSSALDIEESRKLLTGREGDIPNVLPSGANQFLYPMRFVELVETLDEEIGQAIKYNGLLRSARRFSIFSQLTTPNKNRDLSKIFNMIEKFDEKLEDLLVNYYLLGGGYPKVLNYLINKENIPPSFYDELYTTVVLDAGKLNLDKRVMEATLEIIANNHINASGIDYYSGLLNGISQKVGIKKAPGSRHPAEKYVEYLANLKFSILLFEFDMSSSYPHTNKYQGLVKTYFRDPFIFQAVYSKIHGIPNPFKYFRDIIQGSNQKPQKDVLSKIIEGVVASHVSLLPFLLNAVPNYQEIDTTGFYREESKEIDIITWTMSVKTGTPLVIPIEVKYRKKIRDSDLENAYELSKKINRRVIVATQKEYRLEKDVALIPIHWLLMLT